MTHDITTIDRGFQLRNIFNKLSYIILESNFVI